MAIRTQEHFSPSVWFAERALTYKLREPAPTTQGLRGPYRCRGACLTPLVIEGDSHYYDFTAQPQDGDVVLVQWAPDRLADVRATPNGQAYPAKYGEPVGEIASKVYKIFAGEDWLFENEGAIRVGDNKIIGVLKKAYRPGFGWLYGDAVVPSVTREHAECSQIGHDAVSQIVTAQGTTFSNAQTNAFSPMTTSPVFSVAITCTGAPVSIDISGSYELNVYGTGVISSWSVGIYRDGSPLSSGGSFTDSSGVVFSETRPFTFVASDSPSVGAHTYSLVGSISGTVGGSTNHVQLTLFAQYIKVREIKR
jgi:hypothetical protein